MFHKIKIMICVFILCFVNNLALASEIKRYVPRLDYTFKVGNRRDISRLGILAPIFETKSGLLFSNIFGLYDSRDDFEINLGLGYRELVGEQILGIAAFFDKRKSNTGNIFTQGTLSLEYFRRYVELRFNGYVPIGTKSKEASSVRTFSPRSYLQVSQAGFKTEKALWGLDVEIGGSLPFLERLSGHVAYYHFNDEDIKAINGVRFRSSLKLSEYISLEGEIARDRLRDVNYLVGARVHIEIGGKSKQLLPLEQKMTQMVIRDIDIITEEVEDSFEVDKSKELSYKADWDETGKLKDVTAEEAKDILVEIDEDGNIKDVDFRGRKPKGYILEQSQKRAQRLSSNHNRSTNTPTEPKTNLDSERELILDNLDISRSNALKVLGLGDDATAKDIKKAFRKLSRIHHPDRGGDADNFNCLQDAYNIALSINQNDYKKLVHIVGKSSYNNNYAFVPEGFNQTFIESTRNQVSAVNSRKALTLYPNVMSSTSISGQGIDGEYSRIEFEDSKTARLVGATKSISIEPHYIKGIPKDLTRHQLTKFIENSRFNVNPLLDKHTRQINGYTIDAVGILRGGMWQSSGGNSNTSSISSRILSSIQSQDSSIGIEIPSDFNPYDYTQAELIPWHPSGADIRLTLDRPNYFGGSGRSSSNSSASYNNVLSTLNSRVGYREYKITSNNILSVTRYHLDSMSAYKKGLDNLLSERFNARAQVEESKAGVKRFESRLRSKPNDRDVASELRWYKESLRVARNTLDGINDDYKEAKKFYDKHLKKAKDAAQHDEYVRKRKSIEKSRDKAVAEYNKKLKQKLALIEAKSRMVIKLDALQFKNEQIDNIHIERYQTESVLEDLATRIEELETKVSLPLYNSDEAIELRLNKKMQTMFRDRLTKIDEKYAKAKKAYNEQGKSTTKLIKSSDKSLHAFGLAKYKRINRAKEVAV